MSHNIFDYEDLTMYIMSFLNIYDIVALRLNRSWIGVSMSGVDRIWKLTESIRKKIFPTRSLLLLRLSMVTGMCYSYDLENISYIYDEPPGRAIVFEKEYRSIAIMKMVEDYIQVGILPLSSGVNHVNIPRSDGSLSLGNIDYILVYDNVLYSHVRFVSGKSLCSKYVSMNSIITANMNNSSFVATLLSLSPPGMIKSEDFFHWKKLLDDMKLDLNRLIE